MKRTFTLNLRAVFILSAMFCFIAASAEPTKGSDFFGKWKFTCNMELTEAGQEYADLFKSECDVEFSTSQFFDMTIGGYAGSTASQSATVDFENHTITVKSPNPNGSYWTGVYMSDADGIYPFYPNTFQMTYSYDPETMEITVPDFTAVTVNHAEQTATVLAKFTKGKLVPVELETVEIVDMTGEYHFNGARGASGTGDLSDEFDMTLTATSADFTTYTSTWTFEGYEPVTFENVTFDGTEMVFPFDSLCLSSEPDSIIFTEYGSTARTGEYTFNKSGDNLTLTSGLYLRKLTLVEPEEGEESEEEPVAEWRWLIFKGFSYGTAVKVQETADFAGTYKAKATVERFMDGEEEYPAEFEIKITYNESSGRYYIVNILGYDTYAINYGGIAGDADGNTLNFTVDKYLRTVELGATYDKIYDKAGGKTDPLKFTLNEDGTVDMDDFFIYRIDFNNPSADAPAAYYSNLSVRKQDGDGVKEVKVAAVDVYAQDGAICVAGGAEIPLEVYGAAGQLVFRGVASRVAVPAKGVYIVKSGAASAKVAL